MARHAAIAGLTALFVALNTAAPAAAASDAPFVPGTGSAAATVERIALRSSGATLGIGVGTAKARYQGAQGNAEAAGVDLGMLEVASKSPVACGRGMGDILPPEAMPGRVKVSSGDGPSAERSASFGAGTPLEIGSQSGSARPNSAADAAVGGVNLDLPGLLRAVGGTARSAATLSPGRQRLAQAESGMGTLSLAGGLVQLEGMRWTAAHRTGTAADAAAGFAVGGMSVGGRALPTPDAASVADGFARANAALAPLGLSLNPPVVVRGDRGVAVTPLRLTVTPTPALKAALVTALAGAQPARTELLKLLAPATMGEDCGMSDAVGFGYLIADLALVVLGDGGGIDVDFGGATAGTYFATYANPLQSGYGAITPAVLPPGTEGDRLERRGSAWNGGGPPGTEGNRLERRGTAWNGGSDGAAGRRSPQLAERRRAHVLDLPVHPHLRRRLRPPRGGARGMAGPRPRRRPGRGRPAARAGPVGRISMMQPQKRALGAAPKRIFGGYGPLLALVVAFLLIVTMVPTIAREQLLASRTSAEQAPGTGGAVAAGGPAGPAGEARAVATRTVRAPATGKAPADRGQVKVTVPGRRTAAALPAAVAKAAGPCSDRRVQVLGDTYSPPCIAWPKGKDNGGATSRGVTRDKIRISFRLPVEDIRDYQSIIAQLTGGKGENIPQPTEADVRRTVDGFVKYFERNFQSYGRKIELVEWKGKGSAVNEIVGAGQEAANADAIRAAKELKVFADVSAFTQPYNDALARQGVVAIGAPYMSREWFAKHAPYSWSPFPDCTTLAENIAEYLNKRVFGHPAEHAGPGVVGKPRKVGLVAPDNPEYQQCADAGEKIIKAAGNEAGRYSYTLDLATLSDQANNIAAKLKQDGITTVVLATDPLLPLLLTSRMSQQDYYPEWVVTGTALTDLDIVGQFYDQSQWKHAFGLSNLGEQQPEGASYAYAAFKSVYPNHEPVFGSELIYYFFYMVATGIHMAGPNLTPQTFADGMHAYPGGRGPAGTWGYPEGEYTPYRDSREIWWDPDGTSVFNNAQGRYASTNDRYKPGEWPAGPAAPALRKPAAAATMPRQES